MYHACITACITLARFVTVVVWWDITDKWHSVMLSPYLLIKIGLELLNGIIYNGALCLTSNSNRNQLINNVWKQERHFGYSGSLERRREVTQLCKDNLSRFPLLILRVQKKTNKKKLSFIKVNFFLFIFLLLVFVLFFDAVVFFWNIYIYRSVK